MLKADLHIHTKEDSEDYYISYSAKEVIDKASQLNFDVLAFTFHDKFWYPDDIVEYAKSKNILLFPGVEKMIEGKHVLIYNPVPDELKGLSKIEDLRNLSEKSLIVAPHPYFLMDPCLGNKLDENIDIFHGVEFSFFYNHLLDRNKKAVSIATKYNKALIGNSDLHFMDYFGMTYSLIDSNKDIDSIIDAIKKNRCNIETKSLSTIEFIKVAFRYLRYLRYYN